MSIRDAIGAALQAATLGCFAAMIWALLALLTVPDSSLPHGEFYRRLRWHRRVWSMWSYVGLGVAVAAFYLYRWRAR